MVPVSCRLLSCVVVLFSLRIAIDWALHQRGAKPRRSGQRGVARFILVYINLTAHSALAFVVLSQARLGFAPGVAGNLLPTGKKIALVTCVPS